MLTTRPDWNILRPVSFNELLDNLATLTPEQRELVVQRVIELDELPLSSEQENIIQERRKQYGQAPDSFLTIDELERRLSASEL
jgi:hypothetical protein